MRMLKSIIKEARIKISWGCCCSEEKAKEMKL
jgi:hypothetical protein